MIPPAIPTRRCPHCLAQLDGRGWTTATLVSEGEVGSYSSQVMPCAGYSAIAYNDGLTHDMMMVYRPFQPTHFAYTPAFP